VHGNINFKVCGTYEASMLVSARRLLRDMPFTHYNKMNCFGLKGRDRTQDGNISAKVVYTYIHTWHFISSIPISH